MLDDGERDKGVAVSAMQWFLQIQTLKLWNVEGGLVVSPFKGLALHRILQHPPQNNSCMYV